MKCDITWSGAAAQSDCLRTNHVNAVFSSLSYGRRHVQRVPSMIPEDRSGDYPTSGAGRTEDSRDSSGLFVRFLLSHNEKRGPRQSLLWCCEEPARAGELTKSNKYMKVCWQLHRVGVWSLDPCRVCLGKIPNPRVAAKASSFIILNTIIQ